MLQNGELIVNNCTVSNLNATVRGGFASLLGDDTLLIENSYFENIRSKLGAGIYSFASDDVTIKGSTFKDFEFN